MHAIEFELNLPCISTMPSCCEKYIEIVTMIARPASLNRIAAHCAQCSASLLKPSTCSEMPEVSHTCELSDAGIFVLQGSHGQSGFCFFWQQMHPGVIYFSTGQASIVSPSFSFRVTAVSKVYSLLPLQVNTRSF